MSKPNEERPPTAPLVELHVLYVPEEQWNSKLNRASTEAIDSFVSAGFIRVHPDLNLQVLRDGLCRFLGADKEIETFSFLKCVGRSLALVKANQEKELKVKFFAPPHAPEPELYLLPRVGNDRNSCSVSLTPDRQNYPINPQIYSSPLKVSSVPPVKKESTKFPRIKPRAPCNPPAQSQGDEGNSSSEEEKLEELSPVQEPRWTDTASLQRTGTRQQPEPNRKKAELALRAGTQGRNKKTSVKKSLHGLRNSTRDSGVPESLEDRDSEYLHYQGRKTEDSVPLKDHNKKETKEVYENLPLPTPAQYSSPPAAPFLAQTAQQPAPPVFLTDRDELIEEIKLAKQERKQLEKTRQNLLRKAKELLGRYRHRRNQARDTWKKKYFETKKTTVPLEDGLKNLRQELEKYYHKLQQQLQARDTRSKPQSYGHPSNSKNDLIIQMIAETHEIDQLRKKVEDAKMKLVTEIKLRKQIATEVRALRAELAQKRAQLSLSCPQGGSAAHRFGYQARLQARHIPV
ncbi:spermatogenesis-associated protein 1 [Lepisosteus oculatus]|uniref:spermatogenesis-associated protein 1 n=1 Tax=Lepisosteus oculatus TaxID=7918 RepID=UPI0037239A8E